MTLDPAVRNNRLRSVWGGEMRDDEEPDVGDFSAYEDIVQEVLAGRTEGHVCPSCGDGELQCTVDEMTLSIRCLKCGRFFEGVLG